MYRSLTLLILLALGWPLHGAPPTPIQTLVIPSPNGTQEVQSGATLTIDSGATIINNGTATGFSSGSAVWGNITGTLSSQSDLQAALNAKLSITTAASTYAPLSGANLTGATINGVTLAGSGTLTIGSGGTLGTNAYSSTTYAPLNSPAFTGVPIAPTATVGTNTTQLATTAFVLANGSTYTLPASTTSTLGGIIIPASSGLTVDISGNIGLNLNTGLSISANKLTIGTLNQNTTGSAGSVPASGISGLGSGVLGGLQAATNSTSASFPTIGYLTNAATTIGASTTGNAGTATFATSSNYSTNSGYATNSGFATNAGSVGSGTYLPYLTAGVPGAATSGEITNSIGANVYQPFGSAPAFATNVTGIVAVPNGGTGTTNFPSGAIPTGNGTSAFGYYQPGAGVTAANTNAAGGPNGMITNNASGYGAPNVGTTKYSYLGAGFGGGFETGRERGFTFYSGDYINRSTITGLNNYTPPTTSNFSISGSGASPDVFTTSTASTIRVSQLVKQSGFSSSTLNGTFTVSSVSGNTYSCTGLNGTGSAETGASVTAQTGIRDTHITKIGIYYYVCYTISNYAVGQSLDVASSLDLVTWVHTSGIPATGFFNPACWFTDPTTGNLYLEGNTEISQVTSISPTSITTGSVTTLTVSGANQPTTSDQALIYSGGQYILLYGANSPQTYYVATSSTITGTYTEQGVITNCPTGIEGGRAAYNPGNGLWYFEVSSGQFMTSSTPATPSSWSAPQTVNSVLPGGSQFAQIDNGGGFFFNDMDTMKDVKSALAQQQNIFAQPAFPDTSGTYLVPYGINFVQAPQTTPCQGTLTISGNSVTGANTAFTHQLQVGSSIIDSGGHVNVVAQIASDTSLQILQLGRGWTGGTFTTSLPFWFTASSPNNVNDNVFIANNASTTQLVCCGPESLTLYSGPSNGNTAWWFTYDSSGDLQLDAAATTKPLQINTNASTGEMTLANGQVQIAQALSVTGTTTLATSLSGTLSAASGVVSALGKGTPTSGNSGTPAVVYGTGANTPTSTSIVGNGESGTITFTTGATPATASTLLTATFASSFAYPTGCTVVIYPGNSSAALLTGTSMLNSSGTTTTFVLTSGTAALTGLTSYVLNYQVKGY
jgi:hypothetical protein